MSIFEFFLLVSSIISLSVAARLYYINHFLNMRCLSLINQQIVLYNECINLLEELNTLKQKKDNIK